MTNVTAHADAAVDIWPYVDALDLDEHRIPSLHDAPYVYRDATSRFDHVLIGASRFNALLVIAVDRNGGAILAHSLLDLNKEYAVHGGHLKLVG